MGNMTRFIIALMSACVLFWSLPAEAHHRHHHHRYHHAYRHHRIHYDTVNINESVVGGRPAGCPSRFCGCEASLYIFGRIIPSLNLAYNWIVKFPHAFAAPGMAAARSGHVMVLISHVEGNHWLVHDGNSGRHLTRNHVRSIAGFTIVNPSWMKVAAAY